MRAVEPHGGGLEQRLDGQGRFAAAVWTYDGQQAARGYLTVQVVHDRMTGITERQVVKMQHDLSHCPVEDTPDQGYRQHDPGQAEPGAGQ